MKKKKTYNQKNKPVAKEGKKILMKNLNLMIKILERNIWGF